MTTGIEVPTTTEIQFAKCECAAGIGPKATCKLKASQCYALEDLIQWNQLRGRQLLPTKLNMLDFSVEKKREKKRKSNLKGTTKDEVLGEMNQGDVVAVRDLKGLDKLPEN